MSFGYVSVSVSHRPCRFQTNSHYHPHASTSGFPKGCGGDAPRPQCFFSAAPRRVHGVFQTLLLLKTDSTGSGGLIKPTPLRRDQKRSQRAPSRDYPDSRRRPWERFFWILYQPNRQRNSINFRHPPKPSPGTKKPGQGPPRADF